MKTTWLAQVADFIAVSFERLSPAMYRLLAAVLPYTTPLPVAYYTAQNTSELLNFDPIFAVVFAFSLEGIGLWFTSLFVDTVIEWIRSRNKKTLILILLLGISISAYLLILVSLNVAIDTALKGNENGYLSRVITMICMLPFISGIGNGYYRWKLEAQTAAEEEKEYQRKIQEERWRMEREYKLKAKALKHGINVFEQASTSYQDVVRNQTPSSPIEAAQTSQISRAKKGDWRLLTPEEQHEVLYVLSVPQIMEKYGVSRSTAFGWKSKKM
jgi:uncharacterized membrane protein YqjE